MLMRLSQLRNYHSSKTLRNSFSNLITGNISTLTYLRFVLSFYRFQFILEFPVSCFQIVKRLPRCGDLQHGNIIIIARVLHVTIHGREQLLPRHKRGSQTSTDKYLTSTNTMISQMLSRQMNKLYKKCALGTPNRMLSQKSPEASHRSLQAAFVVIALANYSEVIVKLCTKNYQFVIFVFRFEPIRMKKNYYQTVHLGVAGITTPNQ